MTHLNIERLVARDCKTHDLECLFALLLVFFGEEIAEPVKNGG
jgi:hypothetical protein